MKTKVIFCIIFFIIIFPAFAKVQELPEQYREKFSESFPIRKMQHLEIKEYIDKLLEESIEQSLTFFKPDFSGIEQYKNSLQPYRERLSRTLGYPPPNAKKGVITKFIKAGEDVHCTIYRVWVEIIDGVTAYGIYMLPKNIKGKAPLIIAQHGGGGNPEAICDLDTRINYHSFGPEAVKRGYIVWAPALAMRCGYGGDPDIPGANRNLLNRRLKLLGTSIIGLEIHKIIQSTKALIKNRPEIDENRVGMTGLSWGGYFTLHTTALFPLIKVAVPSASFVEQAAVLRRTAEDNSKRPVDKDIFRNLGNSQVAGLICPRPLMVQLGQKDTLFDLEGARREAKKVESYYKKLGVSDRFKFSEHPGGHVFHIESIFEFFDKHLR